MTKKNKMFLAGLLAVLMILLVSCGKKPAEQPTEEAPAVQTPNVYTVQLCSDSGYPLEGIGIYVYTDATQQELVWFARTDAEGKITFRDVTCEGYVAFLDGVSSDYIVEEYYSLTGETTCITVAAQMQSVDDLSLVTKKLGDVMFDFTITDCEGKEYALTELLKEKDAVVLNFWYLNCGPCRQEFPYLQEAYESYSDKIEILAMNPVDGTDEEIAAFTKELELTFPMFQCDPQWAAAMQLTAYPTTVIIARFGVISLIHTGSVTAAKVFEDAFAHFTAEDYVQGTVKNIEDLETEAPGAKPSEPIELGGVTSFQATIPAGGEVYYHLYRVNGHLEVTDPNVYAKYNGASYEAQSGGFGFNIKSPDTYTPAKLTLGNSGNKDVTITVNIIKPRGLVDNPYSAKLNEEFTTKVAAGNDQGVYYQVTAKKTGYLVFECLKSPSKVAEFDYVMQNLTTNALRSIREDGNEEGTKVSIAVKKGEKVKCWIVANKDKSGNKYPGGTFKSKLYMSDTPVKEEAEKVETIDYAVTVTDENRKAISGVSMNVDMGDGKPHVWTTDKNGVGHEKLEPGTYPVVLTLPAGYTATTTEFTLTKDRTYVSIKLDTLLVVTETYAVTVKDEAGNPAAGVDVMIGTQMVTTDAEGKAIFVLPKGTHTVTISGENGAVQNHTFEEGATEITIILGQSEDDEDSGEKLTYTVKVVDYSGNTRSGITVQFLKAGKPVSVQKTDGNVEASAELAARDYTVSLVSSSDQLYFDAESAKLTSTNPSATLRVTGTKATSPTKEWFGITYVVKEGATYVELTQANVDTYFAFAPEREGTYRISVSNANAELADYGSINYPVSQGTTGTYELNVKPSNLGSTYAIRVTGAKEYVLTIERIGAAVLDESDIPWQPYAGKPPTKAISLGSAKNFTYIDLTADDVTVVLGSDGYYHLNSATGKRLFVNLGPNAPYISMYTMLGVSGVGGTKFGKIFYNEDHTVKIKEDYTECMIAYIKCMDATNQVYPLNEDLMYMLKNGGEHMGWWDASSESFQFADLGSDFNPDLGWMFAVCYY